MNKILITGAEGQVGTVLSQQTITDHGQLISCSRKQLDITSIKSIHKNIQQYQPDVIINTAAYTAVDKAEIDSETAFSINHVGAKNLAQLCQEYDISLMHLSTDYVFDGSSTTPYTEDMSANPINVYGLSKLQGEEAIRAECERHLILRVSGIFSHYGSNFYKTILRLSNEKSELRIVADQTTCPTHANDIAGTLITLARNITHWGTYHYCSTPPVSWYEFALSFIEPSRHSKIVPIPTSDYPTSAKRPRYSALNCHKLDRDYHITQPDWQGHFKRAL